MQNRPDPPPPEPTEEPAGARAGSVYVRLSADHEMVELVLELPPHVALGLAEQLRDAAECTPEFRAAALLEAYTRSREAGRTGAEREQAEARDRPQEPEGSP